MAKQREIEEDREIEIKINGEILEWVPKYVYLGSTCNICGDGDELEEIRHEEACYGNKE